LCPNLELCKSLIANDLRDSAAGQPKSLIVNDLRELVYAISVFNVYYKFYTKVNTTKSFFLRFAQILSLYIL
jgi:hypothetical protein